MASLAFTPANDDGRAPVPMQGANVAELIGSTIEALIALLDALGGDPDCEDDDPAGQCDEDGINTGSSLFWLHGTHFDGPGCPMADAGHVPIYGIDQTKGRVGTP